MLSTTEPSLQHLKIKSCFLVNQISFLLSQYFPTNYLLDNKTDARAYLQVVLPAHVCVLRAMPEEARRGVTWPGTGVTGGCELLCGDISHQFRKNLITDL